MTGDDEPDEHPNGHPNEHPDELDHGPERPPAAAARAASPHREGLWRAVFVTVVALAVVVSIASVVTATPPA